MFDVFFNALPHGQGVLLVHAASENYIYEALTVLDSPSDCSSQMSKFPEKINNDYGAGLTHFASTTADPNGDPPRPPKFAIQVTGKTIVQVPRPMADPDGDPPIKPK